MVTVWAAQVGFSTLRVATVLGEKENRCCFPIFYEFSYRIIFGTISGSVRIFISLTFFFVMCLVCVLSDVCSIFDCTVSGLYIMLVWDGDIIVDASAIIGVTRFVRIPIFVGDLIFLSMRIICLLFRIGIGIISSFVRMTYILTDNICI